MRLHVRNARLSGRFRTRRRAALVLLNDPSFVEAARALAAQGASTSAPADDNGRIQWAWRQVLGRDAEPAEANLLAKLLKKHRDAIREG